MCILNHVIYYCISQLNTGISLNSLLFPKFLLNNRKFYKTIEKTIESEVAKMSSHSTQSSTTVDKALSTINKHKIGRPEYKKKQQSRSQSTSVRSKDQAPAYKASSPYYKKANVHNKSRFQAYAEVLKTLRTKFPSIPDNANIVDMHGPLALITVPFSSSDSYWRNSIIDIVELRVIKHGIPITRYELENDEELPSYEGTNKNVTYSAVFDGAQVSVILYKGVVYYVTSKRLGINKVAHRGAADVGQLLREISGLEISYLWPEGTETGLYFHNFIVVDSATLDVTRADVGRCVVYMGYDTLYNLPPGASTAKFTPGSSWKPIDKLIPGNGIYYASYSSKENVEAYLQGFITGAKESAIVTFYDEKGRPKEVHRYNTKDYNERHKLRGDIQDIFTRVLQLMTTYELSEDLNEVVLREGYSESEELKFVTETVEKEGRPKLMILIDIIFDSLRASLPLSRMEEIDMAKGDIYNFIYLCADYLSRTKNDRHPLSKLQDDLPKLTTLNSMYYIQEYFYNIVDYETLIGTARWYHFIFKN